MIKIYDTNIISDFTLRTYGAAICNEARMLKVMVCVFKRREQRVFFLKRLKMR